MTASTFYERLRNIVLRRTITRFAAVAGAVALSAGMLSNVPASADPSLPSAEPTVATAVVDVPSPSGNWIGPWPTTPVPDQQVPDVMASNALLQVAPTPTTPGQIAAVAKSQISLSPTKPQQVSAKSLDTAGGRVASRVVTVPDDVETLAGITQAGTKMVITSDTSKLSTADKAAMVEKAPLMTRALVPVNEAGKVAAGLAFRSTFQTGERLRFEGTVTPQALKQRAYLVIEKADIAPDGTTGRFFRTHTISPDNDGKYAQNINVRSGLEVVRHRLITQRMTVSDKVDWATVKARAEAILAANEQALLADIAADAKRFLSKEEAALLAQLKVAVRTEAKSFVLAHMSLVGTGLITVTIESMKGSRDITINWANQPQDGCDPSTTQDCTMSYVSVPLNSEQTRTVTFVAPTEQNAFGFSADGINGEKYTLNWSLDPNHTTTCAKITPGPSTLMKLGSTWEIQLESKVQIEGYLSGPAANEAWSGTYSKKQNKGSTPLGCGFKGTQSFGTWWTNLAGWEKLLIKTLATIAVSMATLGAYDAVIGAEAVTDGVEIGVEVAEAATDTTSAASAADAAVGAEVDAAAGEAESLAVQDAGADISTQEKEELEVVQSGGWSATGLSDRWQKVAKIVTNRVTGAICAKVSQDVGDGGKGCSIPGSSIAGFFGSNFNKGGLVIAS